MKKLVSIFLAIVLMVSAPFALAESSYTPGTYTAQAEGLNGPVTVEVTFSENAIESVVVAAHKETPGISDGAIEKIPAEIVAGQTLNLDAVSGATYTSNAILNAVADAVAQAGGDAEALLPRARPMKKRMTLSWSAPVTADCAPLLLRPRTARPSC